MGWRYRKRIKILPGIHINISKSGISTNIGVKGANVSFGPKGTYVNTGFPGTGLYRRDKIAENPQYQTDNQSQFLNDSSESSPFLTKNHIRKRAKIVLFNPYFYFLYFLSLILPVICFGFFCTGYLNMFACCLYIGAIQLTCYFVIKYYYSTAYDKYSKEKREYVREEIRKHPEIELKAHSFGRFISIAIALFDMIPLLSMNRDFVNYFNNEFGISQEVSTVNILFFSAAFVFLWLNLSFTEKRQIESLKSRLKATNNEIQTEDDEVIPVKEEEIKGDINQEENGCETKVDDTSNDKTINNSYSALSRTEKPQSIVQDTTSGRPSEEIGAKSQEPVCYNEDITVPYDPKLDLEDYKYPTLELLKQYKDKDENINIERQNANKDRILKTLFNLGIEISAIKSTVGPWYTFYEILPAPGESIRKFRGLEDDLALAFSARGVRIIAPIPEKGTVGIEVPNMRPSVVSMESILNSKAFQESTMELPCAIGKTVNNEVFMFDLAKAPHILIAGSTGQGKSVAINAIITSLLYKKHPAELKFVLVDPNKVEFSVYNLIVNHFLAQVEGDEENEEPIITDANKAIETLKSLCIEMETRYDLLKRARVRNAKEYNQRFKNRELNPKYGHKFMPYIVVIIDEYANFISEKGTEFEKPLLHLAELARAVGIHLIISTKRPTNDIITGSIKTNFPTRISFRVPESLDSRVILDRSGAERLLGNGDMLYINGDTPVRVQCAFVDTPEVENIASYIACQQSYNRPFPLPEIALEGDDGGYGPDVDLNHLDPMFDEVARMVVVEQCGSSSMIQRKFSIGYNRAGLLMDQLEKAGIVGPSYGSKPRKVLCQTESELSFILNNIH